MLDKETAINRNWNFVKPVQFLKGSVVLLFVSLTLLSLLSNRAMADVDALNLAQLEKSKAFARFQTIAKAQKASLAVLNPQGQIVYQRNADIPLIPASTTKILTALLAFEEWGPEYRFYTDFAIQVNSAGLATLFVKGYGDPFLVSEELQLIAEQLAEKLRALDVVSLEKMVLDNQWYEPQLKLAGVSQTDNPYDAQVTAIAANFNTAYVQWDGAQWISAELQTPMTKVAIQASKRQFQPAGKGSASQKNVKKGFKQRINLGFDARENERHFAQLLQSFFQAQKVSVADNFTVVWQSFPQNPPPEQFLRYQNTRSLHQVVAPMLNYSTNFIANQLALNLAAQFYQQPAGETLLRRYFAQKTADWLQETVFEEGAGLSRNNRIAANQMLQILQQFMPYRQLLPQIEPGVFAKSGTLQGVTTLAGYLYKDGQWWPFVLMVNQSTPWKYRNHLIRDIYEALS